MLKAIHPKLSTKNALILPYKIECLCFSLFWLQNKWNWQFSKLCFKKIFSADATINRKYLVLPMKTWKNHPQKKQILTFAWQKQYWLEIVMNEMQKLKMSADFLQINPMIFVGVQECKVLLYIYWWDVIATLLLSKPGGPLVATLVTLFWQM